MIFSSYRPNNPPPPYSEYPQQPPVYQQQGPRVVPAYRQRWNNLVATPMTSNLKTFFIISGILYLIWGILSIGLEVGIIIHSYTTYYRGLWTGVFLIGGGISMLIASCRTSYIMSYLLLRFGVVLFFVILGLILSITNLAISIRCGSSYWFFCDDQVATNLKIGILVLFIVCTIHNIINMTVASNAQKRAILASASNAPRY